MTTTTEETDKTPRLYYRPREVWETTGVSRTKVYAAIRAGDLEAKRVGSTLLVPASAIPAWIDLEDERSRAEVAS